MKRIFVILISIAFAVELFSQEKACQNGKWGYKDNGVWIIDAKYDSAQEFYNGMAAVRINGKWGYINSEGEQIVPFKFDYAGNFTSHLAPVMLMSKYGFIDRNGNMVIPYKYDNARSFQEGFAAVESNGKWGFIDVNGKQTIPYKYLNVSDFSEGLAELRSPTTGSVELQNDPAVIRAKMNLEQAERYSKKHGEKGFLAKYVNNSREEYNRVVAEAKRKYEAPNSVDVPTKGFIDYEGKWYLTRDEYIPSFSIYAKRVIEGKVNKWQQKGKYEKTADWKIRVNDKNRKSFIDSLYAVVQNDYITTYANKYTEEQQIVNYDADNEVFLIHDNAFGDLLIKVPIDYAPDFEQKFSSIQKDMQYCIENDHIALAEVCYVLDDNNVFKYSNQSSLQYTELDIEYNFEPIDIQVESNPVMYAEKGKQTIKKSNISVGSSDVDLNIPVTSEIDKNTFVVILANENYHTESKVKFALNDGEIFHQYCRKTLGVPESNIRMVTDATLNNIRAQLDWLTKVGEAYAGSAKLIFYYAGHGIPDESSKEAYLLPVDGYGSNVATGFKLSDLYSQLSNIPSTSTLVLLDACFSGANRDNTMLASVRGIAVRVKEDVPKGNLVVFSAAQGDETALPYDEQNHGMFTYFLLKKLQETSGDVTLGELSDYVIDQVRKTSVVTKTKPQTPSVSCGVTMSDWRNIEL